MQFSYPRIAKKGLLHLTNSIENIQPYNSKVNPVKKLQLNCNQQHIHINVLLQQEVLGITLAFLNKTPEARCFNIHSSAAHNPITFIKQTTIHGYCRQPYMVIVLILCVSTKREKKTMLLLFVTMWDRKIKKMGVVCARRAQ